MSIGESLALELEHEVATTRRVLEAIPESAYDFRPHAKSMSMIQLASHIAELLSWLDDTMNADELDFNPATFRPFLATTRAELMMELGRNAGAGLAALRSASDAAFSQPWSLKAQGHTLFTMPRAAVVRAFCLSHLIHHRGQLSVYLRLVDAPVPQIYGPTADNPDMG